MELVHTIFKQFEAARQQTLTAFDSSFIYNFLNLSLSSFSHAVLYIHVLLTQGFIFIYTALLVLNYINTRLYLR